MTLPPNSDAWAPWTPLEVSARFRDIGLQWTVVGGWALDLWAGAVTRPHSDTEIAILRPDFETFRDAVADLDVYAAQSGVPTFLPRTAPTPPDVTQFWCLDRAARQWRLDIMIERGTPRRWVYKRDKRISRPRSDAMGFGYRGLPYLNPACVLLFKAKHQRAKDDADFDRFKDELSAEDRRFLRDALALTDPDHPWRARLNI